MKLKANEAKYMDILMVANPNEYQKQETTHQTLFLTTQEFWKKEELVKQYDDVLWQAFRTHGKYMQIMQRASYFAVAVDEQETYLGSAAVCEIGNIWLIEYAITNPAHTQQGVGSAVMDRIMQEAKQADMQFGVLNCDPEKNDGQLPKFYGRFGFKAVE